MFPGRDRRSHRGEPVPDQKQAPDYEFSCGTGREHSLRRSAVMRCTWKHRRDGTRCRRATRLRRQAHAGRARAGGEAWHRPQTDCGTTSKGDVQRPDRRCDPAAAPLGTDEERRARRIGRLRAAGTFRSPGCQRRPARCRVGLAHDDGDLLLMTLIMWAMLRVSRH